jgi:hypothetical protein
LSAAFSRGGAEAANTTKVVGTRSRIGQFDARGEALANKGRAHQAPVVVERLTETANRAVDARYCETVSVYGCLKVSGSAMPSFAVSGGVEKEPTLT